MSTRRKPNARTSANNKSRKRPRTTTQTRHSVTATQSLPNGNHDVAAAPEIPGISPDIVPILLQAIKSQKKYLTLSLSHDNGSIVPPPPPPAPKAAAAAAKELIMARIEQSETSSSRCKLHSSLTIADESLDRLLKMLRNDGNVRVRPSVVLACLGFAYDMAIDRKAKTLLRRCAVRVMGRLLLSLPACRLWLTGRGNGDAVGGGDVGKRLREYCAALGNHRSGGGASSGMAEGSKTVLAEEAMQIEALSLLLSLGDRFGEEEPKWIVAGRYMEEQNGVRLSSNCSAGSRCRILGRDNVVKRRMVRDVALERAEWERERVLAILKRAEVCFRILVPRFGEVLDTDRNVCALLQDTSGIAEENEDREDSEEEDVDWEDGDCGDAEGEEPELGKEDHRTAVERTLAVMAHTGTISEGALTVDINIESHGMKGRGNAAVEEERQGVTLAKTHLKKCVRSLSKRHEPLLTNWIDALLTSDNMTENKVFNPLSSTSPSSKTLSSLVLLPSSIRQRKGSILQMLMELKMEVAQVLTSAARLGIDGKLTAGGGGNIAGIAAVDGNDAEKEGCTISSSIHTAVETANDNYIKASSKSLQDAPGIKDSSGSYNGRKHRKGMFQIKLRKT